MAAAFSDEVLLEKGKMKPQDQQCALSSFLARIVVMGLLISAPRGNYLLRSIFQALSKDPYVINQIEIRHPQINIYKFAVCRLV
jgi:hypothetical protein